MKKVTILSGIIVLLLVTQKSVNTNVRQLGPDYGLPELHAIKSAILSPSYSCQTGTPLQYNNTALFLSAFSKQLNAPDLLFNGACGSDDYFQASTAGDDMALVADLGTGIDLETLSAHLAFNTKDIFSFASFSQFAQSVPVLKKHTYAVLLNKGNIRGLFVFKVMRHIPNQSVELTYAVKEYQVLQVQAASPGFDWTKGNS